MAKLVKYGSRQGWKFTVITANEPLQNIPEDPTLLDDLPENLDIVRLNSSLGAKENILRLPFFSSKSAKWKRWLSAFRYIPDMRLGWLSQARQAVLESFDKQKYDCLLISLPPYSLGLLAADLFREERLPVILDMRDPWSGNPYKLHPTPFHASRDLALELKAVSAVPYGVSAYARLLSFYDKQIPQFRRDNWVTIPNGFDEDDFKTLSGQKPQTDRFNIAFSGSFYSHINNPEPFFKALIRLKEVDESAFNRIHFYHIGKANINMARLVKRFKLDSKVTEMGYVPHKEALEQLAGMDAFVFILDDRDPRSANTIGGKVYEYLRLRKPILGLVPEQGEAADLIAATDSGVAISPQNTGLIAQTLSAWIRQTPHFSFKSVEIYSREEQARTFLDLFERVSVEMRTKGV
jgi:glycosyltransferase involved in cell wall biosynthesis